jgi:Na+/melibiose symporter-like transporter
VLFALKGFCFGSFAYLPSAMLADVVDVDTLRSGVARTGSYFAIMGFMTKLTHSVGGLALVALSWVGYQTTVGATHSRESLEWLAILYAIVPTVAFALGLYLCWTWPLTERKQEQMRRLIEGKQHRHTRRAA